jgi:hypothetical protein
VSVRVFASSETTAARAQLGSRQFKTDDRDCAALTYLARQGQGRRVTDRIDDALAARGASPARPGRRAQGGPAAAARQSANPATRRGASPGGRCPLVVIHGPLAASVSGQPADRC